MRLKVGIDGKPLLPPKTGVYRYTAGLLRGLSGYPPQELEVEVVVPDHPTKTAPWVLWNLQRVTRRGFAVFHFPFYYAPLFPACPVTVAIHDVLPLSHPTWFPRWWVNTLRLFIPRSARRAEAVVTFSRFVAEALGELCRVPQERIRIIPHGVDRTIFSPPSPEARKRGLSELGLEKPFLVMVGALEPRRGVDTLLSAMAMIRQRVSDLELVLVGGQRAPVPGLAPPPSWVRLLGHVEDRLLPALYAGAQVVVAPSRGEGFDLPVLEALACGGCVVASDIPVHREVFSKAVELFPVGDAEALAEAVGRLLEDTSRRQSLRQRGLELASSFSWEKAASEHVKLWRELS
ncbi:MAG: glycosyltransferase family 4 protein [Thermoanaerobaculum sp.]